MTSKQQILKALEELPESLIVLGGGTMAVELAQFAQRMGVAVTIIQRGEHLISGEDPRLGHILADALAREGAAIYTGTAIPQWSGSFMVSTLGSATLSDGLHLHRIQVAEDDPYVIEAHDVYLEGVYGRLRNAKMGPDGHLYLTTSNCEGRGDPDACPAEGDAILRIVGTK